MGTLTATLTNPTNPVLTVSWKDLLNYQLFAVNSLTGRRVPLRRIARANNNFSIKLSQFKRTHRLLKGTYYLSAVSLTSSVSSQSFAIEDLPVSVTALLQGSLLTVTIANPQEIDPEPEPGVYATLFLVLSMETTKMFSSLMYATKQPSQIFPEVSTYTLTDITFLDGTPLVNGSYIAQIYFGNKPAQDYGASDPFYYNITGEWPLSEVLQVGNTASTDIDLDGNDITNVNNIKLQPNLDGGNNIYAQSELLTISNAGVVTYNEDGTIDKLVVGDVQIDSGPNGNVILGGAAEQVSINGPVYLARNTTGTNPTYLACNGGTDTQYIDFHCNSANNNNYDVRIQATGVASTDGQGSLSMYAGEVFINSTLSMVNHNIVGVGNYITGTDGTDLVITGGKDISLSSAVDYNINFAPGGKGTVFSQSDFDMTSHKIINLGEPLLCSYTSLPTLLPTQVGFSADIVYTNSLESNVLPTEKNQLGSFGIPSAGVWYIQFNYVVQPSSQSFYSTTTIFLESADQTQQYAVASLSSYTSYNQYISLNACIPISGATALYVRGSDTISSTYVSANGYYTRIA
jgi:hypothetical protein